MPPPAKAGSVPNLSLAVEHGFYYRMRAGPWEQLLPGVNTSWRDVAEAIVKVYTKRTSGSYIAKKGASISWNYQDADPEFGAMQARELQYHLQGVLTAFPVAVRVGKGYVEACPKGVNKGAMAERLIDIAQGGAAGQRHPGAGAGTSGGRDAHGSGPAAPLDFVLCIGDDSSDELMFQALHSKFGTAPPDMDLFTATVGRKPSEAQAYLGDHTDVVELLKMLSSVGNAKSKKFMSMGDLVKLDTPESTADSLQGGKAAGASSFSQRRSMDSTQMARTKTGDAGAVLGSMKKSSASYRAM